MAQIIFSDDEMVGDELIYGRRSYELIEAVGNRLNNYTEVLTEAGAAFMSRARETFDRFSGHEAVRKARRALRSIGNYMQPDAILDIDSVSGLQLAKPRMQRYIMADPMARRMYYEQRIEGYGDSYVDRHQGYVGEAHRDYRLMTQDMIRYETVNEKERAFVTHFIEEIREGEEVPSLPERFDIQRSLTTLRRAFTLGGEDPTSRFGAML